MQFGGRVVRNSEPNVKPEFEQKFEHDLLGQNLNSSTTFLCSKFCPHVFSRKKRRLLWSERRGRSHSSPSSRLTSSPVVRFLLYSIEARSTKPTLENITLRAPSYGSRKDKEFAPRLGQGAPQCPLRFFLGDSLRNPCLFLKDPLGILQQDMTPG